MGRHVDRCQSERAWRSAHFVSMSRAASSIAMTHAGAADAQGICRSALPRHASGQARPEGGVARCGLARRVRGRRRPQGRRFAKFARPWATIRRLRGSSRPLIGAAIGSLRPSRPRNLPAPIAPPRTVPLTGGCAARAIRPQRQRQHRVSGRRVGSDRSRVRHGLGLAPRVFLERAVVCALPHPSERHCAPDRVRQARHRPLRSGAGESAADARTADGRCACGDGGGGTRHALCCSASPKVGRCARCSRRRIPKRLRR